MKQDIYSIFNVDGSVLALQQSDHLLVSVDNSYCISSYDINSLVQEHSMHVSKNAEPPHRYSHAFSASKNGLICAPIVGTKKAAILEMGDNITKKSIIKEHSADIESSAFSPDGRYYATGGQDGRTFIYDAKNFTLLGSLLPRFDYISMMQFSRDSELFVCSGFDKTTIVFDMVQNKFRCTIKTPDVVERADFFDDNQRLYMVLRNGASLVYDIANRDLISSENIFSIWPSALAISPDERFAVVGTRGESLYIVDLATNSRLLEFRADTPGINSIFFSEQFLFVGAIDGTMLAVDYNRGQVELEAAIRVKEYKKAREMIEQNLFLTIHPLMKVFDEDWPQILENAVKLLNGKKIQEATELVEPFIYDQRKAQEFDFYLMQQGAVREFAECVKNKEYVKAYDLTLTNKFLVNTLAFMQLEAAWNRSFMQAKKMLEENPTLNLRQAEACLKPFASSVKKELISQMLKNSKVFTQAEDLIKARDFKGYFSLINQYGFLRETELFKKVTLLGEKSMGDLLQKEQDGAFERAEEIAKFLQIFPSFKRSATERIIIIQQKRYLLNAIDTDNITQAYAIVEEHKSLRSMSQFKEFAQKFETVFEKAKEAAFAGRPKGTMIAFGAYMEVPFWIDRIASLLKIAYLHEIENKISKGRINWRVTLKRFIDRYGRDDALKALIEQHNLEEEMKEFQEEGNFVGYRSHKFVDEIVIFLLDNPEQQHVEYE
ncbi:hypothetical protein CCZ01_00485 [Helicobacter monodelphidis]|nr:hypothetical protein CCZ01_00485 [Helicobacter sp. 15-1451]